MQLGEHDSVSNILEEELASQWATRVHPMGTTYKSRSSEKVSLGSTRPSCIPCPLGALKLSETPFPHPGGPDPSLSQLRTSGWEGDNRGALASAAGFPGGSEGRESACNQEIWDRSLGREDPPGERNPLHYHGPENSTDCISHGLQSQTWLSGLLVSPDASFPGLISGDATLGTSTSVSGRPPPERHFVSHCGLNHFLYRVLVRCNSHIIQFIQKSA